MQTTYQLGYILHVLFLGTNKPQCVTFFTNRCEWEPIHVLCFCMLAYTLTLFLRSRYAAHQQRMEFNPLSYGSILMSYTCLCSSSSE